MPADAGFSADYYKSLFESAVDAVWVHDLDCTIIEANNAFMELSGYSREEVLGHNTSEFFDEYSLQLAKDIRRRILRGEIISFPYDQRLTRKDGSVCLIRMTTSPVTVGENIIVLHIARDVTEERSVEEMLTRITDGSPIATFIINDEHAVIYWNTAIAALSGITKKEIIGTDGQWRAFYNEKRPTMADLIVDGASAEQIEQYYAGKSKKSLLIEGAYEAEGFYPDLEEQGKWLHFTASPLKDRDGKIIGAIETLQDITEEKQLQESMHYYVQQVTRAQEEERRRISRELHDDTSSSLLLLLRDFDALTTGDRVKLPPSVEKELEKLRDRAEEILEQIRRYAQDLRPRILDDMGLVAALEWMGENLEKDDGIATAVHVSGDEEDLSAEEKLLLFRIAQEAINNVRRHARASEAYIELSIGEHTVNMVIEDNGRGFVAPGKVEDTTYMEKLGIIGMYERADLLGGTLTIQSSPREGTSVRMVYPARTGKVYQGKVR